MATINPNDKYAFLFSGPIMARQEKDLENVAETLVKYYNYLIDNIKIVLGTTGGPPNFSGIDPTTFNGLTETELESEMTDFAELITLDANGANKTVLLYFTGWGALEPNTDISLLDIDSIDTAKVDPAWFTDRLNLFGAAQVNVVMQQDYAGGFDTALTNSNLSGWTFTYACAADEPSYGDFPVVMGSYFTHAWTRGLKLEYLPAGTNEGEYADQLGTGSEGTNRLVSMEEAMTFGKEIHDHVYYENMNIPSTPGYVQPTGGVPQYLGLPDLVIRDGSPFWESPDVTLTHPYHSWVDDNPANQDLYIPDPGPPNTPSPPDCNNTVNVAVRNMGTHPVRAYSVAIELFQMGGGGSGDQYDRCDIVPTGGVLFPMLPAAIGTGDDKEHTSLWNIPFVETCTHRCVKTEVELLCGDLDYSWNPGVADNEAQRNIDVLPLGKPTSPSPAPPANGNIKGMKEHIYNLKNPFEGPRDFALVFPKDYFKYREKIDMDWFRLPRGPQAERLPLVIVEKPVAHIPFSMGEKEERQILLSARLKQGFELEEDIRLSFEIIARGPWDDAANVRAAAEELPDFVAFAGFTLVFKKGAATLKGIVLGKDEQPAAGAKVLLRTVNDLQGAAITADEKGEFAFEDINADIYYMQAENVDMHSREHMVVLQDGKVEELTLPLTEPEPIPHQPVKVEVHKIRILDDRDPCIKDKGELTFTAVVVPDLDHERKQVTRLPEKGVYHVSDKPGKNDITLGVTIFKGVVKNRNLSITIGGKEIDCFDPDDRLTRYHRMFCGDPAGWYGEYKPFDEEKDKEEKGEWAIWYGVSRD